MARILQYNQASARRHQAGRCQGIAQANAVESRAIGGDVKQVATYTVDTAADEELTITIQPDGEDARSVSFDEGAAGTTSTKAAGLVAAVNADPILGQYVFATQSTADVIITALRAGEGFTATESETNLSLVQTTANASAPSLRPGTALVREYGSGDKKKVTDADAADAVAKVMTVTPDNVTNSEFYTITIKIDDNLDGVQEVYTKTFTDASATAARLLDAMQGWIEDTISTTYLVATENSTVLTLTSQMAGLDFDVTAGAAPAAGAGDDTNATGGLTVATSTASTNHEFVGVCGMFDTIRYDGSNEASFQKARGNAAPLFKRGEIWVLLDADVSSIDPEDPVLFRVNDDASGEVNGAFRNAASGTDAFPLSPNVAQWVDGEILTDIDGASIALLRLNQ